MIEIRAATTDRASFNQKNARKGPLSKREERAIWKNRRPLNQSPGTRTSAQSDIPVVNRLIDRAGAGRAISARERGGR